jgi:hypothetical protein
MTQPLLTFLYSALSIKEQRKRRKPDMVLLGFSSKGFLFLGLELAGFTGYTICSKKEEKEPALRGSRISFRLRQRKIYFGRHPR